MGIGRQTTWGDGRHADEDREKRPLLSGGVFRAIA